MYHTITYVYIHGRTGRGAEEVVKAHPELHVAQTILNGGTTICIIVIYCIVL